TTYGGQSRIHIARALATGAIDNTITFAGGVGGGVSKILELADGSMLVSGSFTSYNGPSVYRIVRLAGDANPSPVIVNQPQSQSASVGSPVLLSVGVTGFG